MTSVVNKPNKNYKFEKFTCNKDVTLTDGTRIAAGDKITEEQMILQSLLQMSRMLVLWKL